MEDPMDGGIARDMANMAAQARSSMPALESVMSGGAKPEAIHKSLDTIGITRQVRDIVDTTILGVIGGQFADFGIKASDVDPLIEIVGEFGPDDTYWFVPDDEMWTTVMALATLQQRIGTMAAESYLRLLRSMVSEYMIALEMIHLDREKAKGTVPDPDTDKEKWDEYTAEMYDRYDSMWQESAVAGVQFILKLTITTVLMASRPG